MTHTNSRSRREAARARAEEQARRAKQRLRTKWISGAALAGLVLLAVAGWTIHSNLQLRPADTASNSQQGMDPAAMQAFYQCLRDGGLDVEDPDDPRGFALPVDMDDPTVAAIVEDCRDDHLDGGGMMSEENMANTEALVEFVSCMNDNGIDMPDPSADGGLTLPENVDPESAEFQTAIDACQQHLDGGVRVEAPGSDGQGRMGGR